MDPSPVPSLDAYFDRWQQLHAGYDPRTGSIWVRGWLTVVYRLARPLARAGVPPGALTMSTIAFALAVVAAAAAGGWWVLVAGWLLVFSGIGDSLDGAVAVLTGRTSAWGYVVDSVVDRVNDGLYVVALVVVGAPVELGATCAAVFFLLEYTRARAGNAGRGDVALVTVGERANRVALCAAGLYCAGVFPAYAALLSTGALAILSVLSLAGLGQLLVAARRHLDASPGGPDEIRDDRR